MKSINVLMVDDDALTQNLANEVLANRGITLHKAYTTAEADVILQRNKIDVILCDVVMSPENGIDYYNRLCDQRKHPPVILMSAQVSPPGMRESVKSNAANYLIKPFGLDQIYQRIIEALLPS